MAQVNSQAYYWGTFCIRLPNRTTKPGAQQKASSVSGCFLGMVRVIEESEWGRKGDSLRTLAEYFLRTSVQEEIDRLRMAMKGRPRRASAGPVPVPA